MAKPLQMRMIRRNSGGIFALATFDVNEGEGYPLKIDKEPMEGDESVVHLIVLCAALRLGNGHSFPYSTVTHAH